MDGVVQKASHVVGTLRHVTGSVPRRTRDWIFFGYYVMQVVTTLGLDLQGTLPAFLFPSFVQYFHTHHCESWHDPFLADTWEHPWYFAICCWEYVFHIPFYFVAAHAYWERLHGKDGCSWLKLPALMYCTQTMTAVSGIVMMALFEDFSSYSSPYAPESLFQRFKLAAVYSLFFFACLFNLLDVLLHPTDYSKKNQQ